ncbi:MAG: hypothetical protein HKO07_09200, partial [Pseudomonadales bacterium]|nr:hypothetical protein [Pseudomonadales bacterium]
MGALFLLCGAQAFAASPRAGEEQLEQTVIVDAVRMERGVKSKRFDEHVVTYVFWVKSEAALLNLSCV